MGPDKRTIKEKILDFLRSIYTKVVLEKILKKGCANCRYMCSCPDHFLYCSLFKRKV